MGIEEKIANNKFWKQIKKRLKVIRLKNGASLYLFLKTFFKHILDPNLNIMASGIAFNFLMSLFPGIVFLFTLIPYVLPYIQFDFAESSRLINGYELDFTDYVNEMLAEVLPSSLFEFTSSTISDIINTPRQGLLSIGFFFTFYLSTNAMIAIMESFNHFYKTKESRNWIEKRSIALMLTLLFFVMVIVTIIVFIFGNVILESLLQIKLIENYAVYIIHGLRYLIIGLLFFGIISSIYYFAPAVHRKFDFFSAGSITATVLIILVSEGFAYYVNNFGSYNKIYGSIGALVGLMALFYAISYVILFGFQINASLHGALELEKKHEKKSE